MISGNAPPIQCGIGEYTANLLEAIVHHENNFSATWLSRKSRWFHLPLGRCRGVPTRKPWHKWENHGAKLASHYLKWAKPDIVHLQEEYYSYMEGTASLQLARSIKCPLVVTLHAYHLEPSIVDQTNEIIDRADKIICSDMRTANRLLEHTGRSADFVGWCSTPVKPRILSKDNGQSNACFATFGFVHPGKMNFSVVHEALTTAHEEQASLKWKIIGPMDPQNNPHHTKILQKMNESWVKFTGHVSNLNARGFHEDLAKMTAMLLPFRNKTGSNGTAPSRSSLQIAWAFGLPVVASSPIEDEPDLLDGKNCLLVDEDDANAWLDAVKRILTDKQLRQRLRQGSLETARHFGWNRLAEEHARIYRNITN